MNMKMSWGSAFRQMTHLNSFGQGWLEENAHFCIIHLSSKLAMKSTWLQWPIQQVGMMESSSPLFHSWPHTMHTSPKTSTLVFLRKSIFPSSFTLCTAWSFCKQDSTSPFFKASRELLQSLTTETITEYWRLTSLIRGFQIMVDSTETLTDGWIMCLAQWSTACCAIYKFRICIEQMNQNSWHMGGWGTLRCQSRDCHKPWYWRERYPDYGASC